MSIEVQGVVVSSEARRSGIDDAMAAITLDVGLAVPFEVRVVFKADDRRPKYDPMRDAIKCADGYRTGLRTGFRLTTLFECRDHGSHRFVANAEHP